MRKITPIVTRFLAIVVFLFTVASLSAQEQSSLKINPDETRQSNVGFGAALAYYEGWLNAHPRRSEIYELIFGGLSLDILRVRNAYGYDPDMVGRVKEYMNAAETSLGHDIQLFSTSWAPVDSLKNTGDRKNGGTLRYKAGPGGVIFDYAGFASWWKESLAEYEANGIMPDYISIQNEPGWSASYESCLLNPRETINSTDTVAGYDKALDAVYDTLATLSRRPKILGPEVLGIGYNSLEKYTNALDITKLDGLCHHLYHGVDENNPYASDVFAKVGAFHPEVPHFQTEYSRGDWFSLAGLIYKSYHDEEVVSYMYWDLIWGDEGGLVTVEFPWDSKRWTDPGKGYVVNMEYYAFKQFSAFIHPGWKRLNTEVPGEEIKLLTFISPAKDSMTCVVINRSESSEHSLNIGVEGYRISESAIYTTSRTEKCSLMGSLADSLLRVAPHSISTLSMKLEAYHPEDDTEAPSAPANLGTSDLTHESCTLSWDAASDNVGVKYYCIFLDGDSLGSTSATEYPVSSLEPGTLYTLAVSAVDDAGNIGDLSEELTVETLLPDMEAPTVPANLGISDLTHESCNFYWNPSSDSVGVKYYNVYLDGDSLGNTGGTEFLLSFLEMGTTYTLAVSAVDDAGNESELSEELAFTTLYLDLDPPGLECSDSIYQEGNLEVLSSEEGVIYLVPEGCQNMISTIRTLALDSIEVQGGVSVSLPVSGLENGVYWLYARDSVYNLSEPSVFRVYGVGVDQLHAYQFSLYPNPMNQASTLGFTLRKQMALWLVLYDSRGLEVRREYVGVLTEGTQQIILHRKELDGGLYLFKLRGDSGTLFTGRLMIAH